MSLPADRNSSLSASIGEQIAADEIFASLMGYEVEPRSEFIEKNALHATNLDI